MKLKGKIIAGFFIIIVINAVLGGIIISDVNGTTSDVDDMTESTDIALEKLGELKSRMDAMVASQSAIDKQAAEWMVRLKAGENIFEGGSGIEGMMAVIGPIMALMNEHSGELAQVEAAVGELAPMAQSFEDLGDTTQSSVDGSLRTILIFNGIGLLIAVTLSLIISGMIVTPIRKLTQMANSLGEGNIEATMPEIKSKDEVRDLADSIETLRGALKFLKKK